MRVGCRPVTPLCIEFASLVVIRYGGLMVFDVPAVESSALLAW